LKHYLDAMLIRKFSKSLEAGIDEAGRGCLAGPVVAAAVILPERIQLPGLDDSKKLTEAKRNTLRNLIEKKALAWSVAFVDAGEIDKINILNATFLAMNNAVKALKITPELLLIDGNRFRTKSTIPYECIIGGDAKYRSIAAASILAKTHRDEFMLAMHQKHPQYGWDKNKGYGTIFHRKAISDIGSCDLHRHSFTLIRTQLSLEFGELVK